MKRRDFSLAVAATASASALTLPAMAQDKIQAGKDYAAISPRAPVDAPKEKIEVVEFFSYWCPHCFDFEPMLEKWVKALPADVAFRRVPVAFMGDYEIKQKLYFTLEIMGVVDDMQMKVFQATQKSRPQLKGEQATIDWAQAQGLDKAKFTETFNSFSVNSKVKRANEIQAAYKLEGVPALGVAGLYLTDGPRAQSMQRALWVTDQLIAMQRKKA